MPLLALDDGQTTDGATPGRPTRAQVLAGPTRAVLLGDTRAGLLRDTTARLLRTTTAAEEAP